MEKHENNIPFSPETKKSINIPQDLNAIVKDLLKNEAKIKEVMVKIIKENEEQKEFRAMSPGFFMQKAIIENLTNERSENWEEWLKQLNKRMNNNYPVKVREIYSSLVPSPKKEPKDFVGKTFIDESKGNDTVEVEEYEPGKYKEGGIDKSLPIKDR